MYAANVNNTPSSDEFQQRQQQHRAIVRDFLSSSHFNCKCFRELFVPVHSNFLAAPSEIIMNCVAWHFAWCAVTNSRRNHTVKPGFNYVDFTETSHVLQSCSVNCRRSYSLNVTRHDTRSDNTIYYNKNSHREYAKTFENH